MPTVLKKVYVLLIFTTVLLLLYVLFSKNQACNIYKYWSYKRNLRVGICLLLANVATVSKQKAYEAARS